MGIPPLHFTAHELNGNELPEYHVIVEQIRKYGDFGNEVFHRMLRLPACLLITPPKGSSFKWELQEDEVVVGRSSSADLTVHDGAMSRRHARFFHEKGTWFVEDLESKNGSSVNGEALHGRQALRIGDRIITGTTALRVAESREEDRRSQLCQDTQTIFRSAAEILDGVQSKGEPDDIESLRRKAGRLQILHDVNIALAKPISQEELLNHILERVFSELHPEQGAIFLKAGSESFTCAAFRGGSILEVQRLCSRNLREEVLGKERGALVNDTSLDERFRDSQSLIDAGVRSFLAAPLLGPDGALGMIVLCSKARDRVFGEEDMELLVSLSSIAALRLRNLRLVQLETENQRNLTLARKIQVALLPKTLPEISGYSIHAGNIPSLGISGDFYKVVSRGGGKEVLFLLADASGKGIGASLLTGVFESLSAAPIENGWPPEEIVETVSRLLWARTDAEKYATAVLVVLEPESGRLRWVNAGHPPGFLVRRDGTCENLDSTGLPVGLFPEQKYQVGQALMGPEDTVCLYSDGITEAENQEEEEFGISRLRDFCLSHRLEEPNRLAGQIEGELERFSNGVPFADDRTVVIFRRCSSRTQEKSGSESG